MRSRKHVLSVIILLILIFSKEANAASWLEFFGFGNSPKTTFTVNSNGDAPDANTSDNVCDDGAGNCTLRAAIEQANATPGADSIGFALPALTTISPATALPAITQTLTIDGYTQTGASANTQTIGTDAVLLVVIDGANAPAFINGLEVNASNCLIRGLVVMRFPGSGITVSGSNNAIEGNYIGTESSGVLDAGNNFDGIGIFGANNTIGGASPAQRNVVSGNNRYGVSVTDMSGNTIRNNYIGMNALGSGLVSNGSNGVHLFRASNTTISESVISANGGSGIYIFRDVNFPSSGENNVLIKNRIGTNATGDVDYGNSQNGVYIFGGRNNEIGRAAAGEGNLISGNNASGVRIENDDADGNKIQGNFIGTDAAGAASIPNVLDGVVIIQSDATIIGGSSVDARNVISGNFQSGINIYGDPGFFSENNVVKGNYIGFAADGVNTLANGNGNDGGGVTMFRASNNQIGGIAPNEGNVIGANFGTGIAVNRGTGNTVQGNFVGISKAGGFAAPNTGYGVVFNFGSNNALNGGNYVSGNQLYGVWIREAEHDSVVQGNFIGVNQNGDPRGNNLGGVWITENSQNNQIGGVNAGESNTIAFNGGSGITAQNQSEKNPFRRNSIFGNANLGIDLNEDGVSPNDAQDADFGANLTQNYPQLDFALVQNGATNIRGSLNSTPNSTFNLEFFSNLTTTATNHGEGRTFIGSTSVTTDANGNAIFTAQLPVDSTGRFISATATDADGNTSEFSRTVYAQGTFVVTSANSSGEGSLRQAILNANSFPGADTITFNIPAGGLIFIQLPTVLPAITEAVTIDGYSQPGSTSNTHPTDFNGNPRIMLDGNNSLTAGLIFESSGSLVRGLRFNRMADSGVIFQTGSNNRIEGCIFGGSVYGVSIFSSGNFVGGTSIEGRNAISGNLTGIYVADSSASGNTIQNNVIGLSFFGSGNTNGIYLLGSQNTQIGGSDAAARNYINNNQRGVRVENNSTRATIQNNYFSGNTWGVSLSNAATGNTVNAGNYFYSNQRGVNIDFGASGNTIQGNTFGINPLTLLPAGNAFAAVNIDGEGGATDNNAVGGANPGEGNIMKYNGRAVVVFTGAGGAAAGNRISGNSIAENQSLGIDLGFDNITPNDAGDADAGANNLQNFPVLIGAVPAGANSVITGTLNSAPNSAFTIEFFASAAADPTGFGEGENFVGSTTVTTDASGNASFSKTVPLIAANLFVSATATDALGNTSEFSRTIKSAQTFVVTNTNDGGAGSLRQAIADANNSPGTDLIHFNIGGAGAHLIQTGAANLNINESVIIDGYTQPGASPNTLPAGDNAVILIHIRNNAALPNGLGVFASNVTIRGLQISNFTQNGIGINFTAANTVIEGNWLTGNQHGVQIFGANNRVGGANPAQRNIINGNAQSGISIIGFSATGNVVENNYIGTDFSGTAAVPNANAVVVSIDASGNIIGGVQPNAGNLIAFSTGTGVVIAGDNTLNNRVSGNAIHSNGGLGIDLGADGVTPNDSGDPDLANTLQNYPVINSAAGTIQGSLNSAANQTFRVEFFDNAAADASGYGEGAKYLGFVNVATDAGGSASFNWTPPASLTVGHFVSATATDANGNTSEFSLAKQVMTPTAAMVTVGGRVTDASGRGILKAVVTMTDNSGNSRTVLTNPAGYYRLADVPAGAGYVFTVRHKRFQFAQPSQFRQIEEDEENINFIGVGETENASSDTAYSGN